MCVYQLSGADCDYFAMTLVRGFYKFNDNTIKGSRFMCGIAGVVQVSNNARPPNELMLHSMADALWHRGPDDEGVFLCGGVGLCHRRLSIIDFATGQQPMHSAARDVSIVFNGEIFNYIELRKNLLSKGYEFQTESDTEVIIHLYQDCGLDFVNHLNGQFAIALWDEKNKQLVLVRDRVGICPLFYTIDAGRLVFASEIKALKPALEQGLSINLAALDQIFTFWSALGPNTIFNNVFEVSPGQMLVLKNGEIEKHNYWQWRFPDGQFLQDSESQQAEQLHDLLVDATKIRLRADVPVGAYLSGGLDSSVIVALIHHYGGVALRTFSLNFAERDFDEKVFQDELTEYLATEHSRLLINTESITNNIKQTLYHIETPLLRMAPVAMGLLSASVRENGYKVVLTGEGADEVLGGYDIFKESKVRRFWAADPDSSFRPLLLKRLYPYLRLPDNGQGTYLKNFFGQMLDQPENICFSHIPRWVTTAKAKQFFSPELNDALRSSPMEAMINSLTDDLTQMHWFNRAQYIESKSLLSGYLLSSQGDRMLAKNSIEGRFPFLDHRVIEFANKIHPKLKMKALNEKYILKKAMVKYLPKQIIRRKKQPYRAPDAQALAGKFLGAELRHHMSVDELKKNGLFDSGKVQFLLKKLEAGRALSNSETQAVVGILSTQIIIEQFT